MTLFLVVLMVGAFLGGMIYSLSLSISRGGGKLDGVVAGIIVGAMLSIIAATMWLFLTIFTGAGPDYANGSDVGYVTSFSDQGLYWKTLEGQLQLGQGKQSSVQTFESFCVPKALPELAEKVKKFMLSGKKVKITYNEWVVSPIEICFSDKVLTDIQPLKESRSSGQRE